MSQLIPIKLGCVSQVRVVGPADMASAQDQAMVTVLADALCEGTESSLSCSTSHKLAQEENPISISFAPHKGKRANGIPKSEDPPQRVDMEGRISPV